MVVKLKNFALGVLLGLTLFVVPTAPMLQSGAQAAVSLAPMGRLQFTNTDGAPLSGGTVTFYAAGSTTPQNTYTDATGATANTNPITLNVRGITPHGVWLTQGLRYKYVVKDALGNTIYTEDQISGINDLSASLDEWVAPGLTPTYISATQFSLVGDQTSDFHPGRRIRATVSAGTVYGIITASAYTTLTTVTVSLDSGSLDVGLSAVNYGLVRYANTSAPGFIQGGDGAIARSMLDKARDIPLNSKDFGGRTAAAINSALAVGGVLGRPVVINSGTAIDLGTTSISVPAGASLIGEGFGVALNYSGTGAALECAGHCDLARLQVVTSDVAGTCIKRNGVSRNGSMRHIACTGAGGASNTGTGILFSTTSGDSGFSGQELISGAQVQGYLYPIRFVGSTADATWTSVTMLNTILVCNSTAVSSKGIWMDALTNGVGSSALGGTIEQCADGIQTDGASYGISWDGDLEGNTRNYTVGAGYQGCIQAAGGADRFCQTANSTTNKWWQWRVKEGLSKQEASFYGYVFDTYNGGGDVLPFMVRRGTVSTIDGGSPTDIFGAYFQSPGGVNPALNHTIMAPGRRIGYCDSGAPTDTPATGQWNLGDLCINGARVVGSAPSYFPSVAGSPGTWVADRKRGTLTLANNACTTKADTDTQTASVITFMPTNAAAGTLMGSAKSLYVATRTAATSFEVCTADGNAAAGTETFEYMIMN